MPKVAHLSEDSVKYVHVRGEIDPGRPVIGKFLVRLPLIFEGVQLHPHVRRVAFPARTIATFLIRGYFKSTTHVVRVISGTLDRELSLEIRFLFR